MQTFPELASWTRYRTILAEEFAIRLKTEPVERIVPVRGHRLRIDEWPASGAARGTVILVHGGGGNGRILAPFAEGIAMLGWRVLAPDLPGFGLTEPAPGFDWDYAEWPRVIAALADGVVDGVADSGADGVANSGADSGEAPVVLMGLSLGGLTAVYAARQSSNVAGVIATTLLDAAVDEHFIKVARWPWLGRISLLGMAWAPFLVDRIRLPLRLAAPLGAMSANRRMADYFSSDPLIGGSWKPVRFFRTVREYAAPSLRLDCPLLLVHPGADAWTPSAMSLATFERIEGGKRFVELQGGSHLPVEQPAYGELNREIAAFLARLAA